MNFTDRYKRLNQIRFALVRMVEIPDMQKYALRWKRIGDGYAKIGMECTAAICYSNWRRYAAIGTGVHVRLEVENVLSILAM